MSSKSYLNESSSGLPSEVEKLATGLLRGVFFPEFLEIK